MLNRIGERRSSENDPPKSRRRPGFLCWIYSIILCQPKVVLRRLPSFTSVVTVRECVCVVGARNVDGVLVVMYRTVYGSLIHTLYYTTSMVVVVVVQTKNSINGPTININCKNAHTQEVYILPLGRRSFRKDPETMLALVSRRFVHKSK